MQEENVEQQIFLQPEGVQVSPVTSVNGKTGDVVLTTSDLQNTSDYQTGSQVSSAISAHNESEEAHSYLQGLINGKQDQLTAGANVNISEQNVISATDTTYSAGNGINISGTNAISVDTTIVATQQNLSDEVTNRENADIYLQQQIDGISASSDVVDIVGTYAELQAYDTQHLKDNDIIKVLQDETQGGATTYYRWSTSTETFTLIGQEGPYYTKASADAQFVPQTRTVNGKALSANVTLNASDVSALGTSDVVQTTGSSTSQVMSQNAVTTQLNTKLNTSDYVVDDHLANSTNPVQNQVLNGLLGNMPTGFFSGSATTSPTPATELQLTDALCLDDMQMLGNTTQQTYSGKNLMPPLSSGYFISKDGANITTTLTGDVLTVTGSTTGGASFYLAHITQNTDICPDLFTSGNTVSVTVVSVNTVTLRVGFSGAQTEVSVGSTPVRISRPTSSTGPFSIAQVTSGSVDLTITDFQVETGSTATPYEKFVGGTASPNPDYPQAVNVVTGEQNVWVHGKNMFDGVTWRRVNVNNGYPNPNPQSYASTIVASGSNFIEFTNTANYGGAESEFIPVTAGQTFTLSFTQTKTVNRLWVTQYDTSKTRISTLNSSANVNTTTVTTTDAGYITVAFGNTTEGNNFRIDNIQLESGNQATTYEPYQGQNYTIDLTSGNLWPSTPYKENYYISASGVETANNGSMIYGNIPALPHTIYNMTITTKAATPSLRVHAYTSDGEWIEQVFAKGLTASSQNDISFITPANIGLLRWSIVESSMESYSMNRSIELAKIGAYQDKIFNNDPNENWYNPDLEDNAWYVHKACGKTLLTGSEAITSWASGTITSGYKIAAITNLKNITSSSSENIIMSNYFTKAASQNYLTNNDVEGFATTESNLYFRINKTLDPFNTWLSTHNTTVYYALATPTDTKITDSTLIGQLEAVLGMTCYAGQTNIVVTASNLAGILDVTAVNANANGIIYKLRGA